MHVLGEGAGTCSGRQGELGGGGGETELEGEVWIRCGRLPRTSYRAGRLSTFFFGLTGEEEEEEEEEEVEEEDVDEEVEALVEQE